MSVIIQMRPPPDNSRTVLHTRGRLDFNVGDEKVIRARLAVPPDLLE
jgi:hypothetical protein